MARAHKYESLDTYDSLIVDILSTEGRLSVTEIANRVGLSSSPCQVRIKRLVKEGYILNFQAMLNPSKLKLEHVVFVAIRLSDTTEKGLLEFNKEVIKIPEVETCHLIAADFDYLIKVRTNNIKSYRKVLGGSISSLPNVTSTSTFVSMEAIIDKI